MLSRSLRRAAPRSPQRPPLKAQLGCRRLQSSSSKPPAPVQPEPTHPSPLHEHFIQQATFTVDFFRRFLKFSAIGLVTVSITTWTAFEVAHQYVERAELAPEQDEEVRRWQWDLEAERWTGGAGGGTDPALGLVGRHLVRAAWMAQHWGTGSSASVIGSSAFSGRGGGSGAGGLNIIEARLEYAQEFLRTALQVAEQRVGSGKLRPQTIGDLLGRHANVMERMGTRDALVEARIEYERIWASQPGQGVLAARTALKLGDINSRLGDKEDALAWWARTFLLLQGKASAAEPGVLTIPESIPSEPLAQRIFVSALVSLSAFHATSGQLRQAQAVEETSLDLLRTIPQPQSLKDASPPQALHALYILHRSSLLSIHLAEVLYALRNKPVASIEWLTRAAESAERVALTLTGLPSIHPDAPQSKIPHPPSSETPLVPAYSKSVSMGRPARGLLRDSRRTAAEAWSLIGVLTEASNAAGAKEKALECYERALGWAGVGADGPSGIGKAGEGVLESEWKVLWGNYVRARDAVLTQAKK